MDCLSDDGCDAAISWLVSECDETVLVYPSRKKFPSAGVCPLVCIVTLRGSQEVLPLTGRWSIPKWNSWRSKFLTWWVILNAEPNHNKVLSMGQSHPCTLTNTYGLRAWRSGPVQEEDQRQEEPLCTRSSGGIAQCWTEVVQKEKYHLLRRNTV
jgi:hypothetical protein